MRLLHRHVILGAGLSITALVPLAALGQSEHYDKYSFEFTYSPPDIYKESISKLLVVDLDPEGELKGHLNIAASGELFYTEVSVDGAPKLQEWRYANYDVRYYNSIKSLDVNPTSRVNDDLIPLWIPAKYATRSFILPDRSCGGPGTGMCVETPGLVGHPVRVPLKKSDGTDTLTLPGNENDFLITWDAERSKLKAVHFVQSFDTQASGSTTFSEHHRLKMDLIADRNVAPDPPKWEDVASKAAAEPIDGVGIRYDPKKGSIWDQRMSALAAIKLVNDTQKAKRDQPPGGGQFSLQFLSSPFIAVGLLIVLAGLVKLLIAQLRR